MTPKLSSLDHLVLTVSDLRKTISFYETVLGMNADEFKPADGSSRWALSFGFQKINLHEAGSEFKPNADVATVGSADLCFLSEASLDIWSDHLDKCSVDILEGPIKRTGATGPILSIYIRDPDGNLIEISNRV